ncbi:MAG: glutamate-5-semialdehyde dehydrogenase [Thermodesulfobacteriota bacterium]|nr:glutamate-5-semialdehyde dehydrogenase [Thermodesulfobacteriota bacterium]
MDTQLMAQRARDAAFHVATFPTKKKNAALLRMAGLLTENKEKIIEANQADISKAEERGLGDNLLRRLVFDEKKIQGRIRSLKKIAELSDPVGQIENMEKRPNGLMVGRMRVPIGVILMIYEARPHVTVNAGAFCLKSGNVAILKGGKEAETCNSLIGRLWDQALKEEGLTQNAIHTFQASHDEISELLHMEDLIDLVIPRGGKTLIQTVTRQSRIPVIKHFEGICHVFIDRDADMEKAIEIAINSKTLMPEVCNAMETLLMADNMKAQLPILVEAFHSHGVEVRGCEKTVSSVNNVLKATHEDWSTEYLDNIISIKMVEDIDQAMEHINKYGSHHTDTIVTESYARARKFIRGVDSGVVLVNASTMFNDGETLGMGAEIGISTDKLHARGPMGLKELTTYKFVVFGDGHVMD